jgi:hypothetical protein
MVSSYTLVKLKNDYKSFLILKFRKPIAKPGAKYNLAHYVLICLNYHIKKLGLQGYADNMAQQKRQSIRRGTAQ